MPEYLKILLTELEKLEISNFTCYQKILFFSGIRGMVKVASRAMRMMAVSQENLRLAITNTNQHLSVPFAW